MKLETKFNILDKVIITALGHPAIVIEVGYDGVGVWYELEYWWDGLIRTVYLYEDELTPCEQPKK